MKANDQRPELDLAVDIAATQPLLDGTYTPFALFYDFPPNASRSAVVSKLEAGLERISLNFPWLAGHVVRSGDGKSRVVRIQSAPHRQIAPLTIKDHTSDASVPSLADFEEAGYPFRMLQESWVCPRQTMAVLKDEEEPCFMVQANFIRGGLLLAVLTQHQAVDGVGQREVLRLFAKACAGEDFTVDEQRAGNMQRADLVPLLGPDYQPGPEIEYWFPRKAEPGSRPREPMTRENTYGIAALPESKWSYFTFTPDALRELKTEAMATRPASCEFVSTDDSLTAFIWRAVTRVRQHRLAGDTETHLSRAVDMRPFFGVSPLYPGMLQYFAFQNSTIAELADAPLGHVAAMLRARLDPRTTTLRHDFQAFCTMLDRLEDKAVLNFMGYFNIDASMFFTSWDRMNCSGLDLEMGLGGPKLFRRPQLLPCPGLAFILPKEEDGRVPVGLCLRLDDLEVLLKDDTFMKYCTYIP